MSWRKPSRDPEQQCDKKAYQQQRNKYRQQVVWHERNPSTLWRMARVVPAYQPSVSAQRIKMTAVVHAV
jgi:hypothetical protein